MFYICNFAIFTAYFFELCSGTHKLQEVFGWNYLDYAFPSEQIRTLEYFYGRYIPENNLPVGIEIWKDKLFVTVPRWREGIPATLNYVSLDSSTKSPLLIPYPDWKFNEAGNCKNGLTTVYRIKADECDRLWVLDTGTFGIEETMSNPCPYALNIFDLKTNKRIRRYEFKKEDTNANTFIANIAVDIGKSCEDAFAFFSDELGYGLVVYSWELNDSWRFTHSYFQPDPLAANFNIAGINFQWGTEGIFGLALTPRFKDFSRILYFHPLASNREFAVSTNVLRNASKVSDSYHDFVVLESRVPGSHVTASVIDEKGVMFFNLIDRSAVGCWNTLCPYHPVYHAVVDKDVVKLEFPSDAKVDRNANLWIVSDKMSTFLNAELDYTEINFRVFFSPISTLINGTVCDLKTN